MTKTSKVLQENREFGTPVQQMAIVACERGDFFTATIEEAAVADSGTLGLLIVTPSGPNDPLTRLRLSGGVGGDATAALYENTVTSNDGSVVTPHNRNRVAEILRSQLALTQVFKDPTVTNNGDAIYGPIFIPGGTDRKTSAGSSPVLAHEWILLPGVKYLVLVTNQSGSVQPAALQADFIEQPV